MSSAPRGVLRFSSLRPLTCFLSVAEQETRPSRSALRWVALAATGTKVSGSFLARRALLPWGAPGGAASLAAPGRRLIAVSWRWRWWRRNVVVLVPGQGGGGASGSLSAVSEERVRRGAWEGTGKWGEFNSVVVAEAR